MHLLGICLNCKCSIYLPLNLKRTVDGIFDLFKWGFIWACYLGMLVLIILYFKSGVWDINLCKYKNYLSAIF